MIRPDFKSLGRNFSGAYADAAILLPIITLLATRCEMNLLPLLLTAGCLYIFSGYFFKVPMSIQPLKSLAIAGITLGVSAYEIKVSTLIFGASLLLLYLMKFDRILEKTPDRWIRSIQFGLGVMLAMQAWPSRGIFLVLLVAVILTGPRIFKGVPILGLVAVITFAAGMIHPEKASLMTASMQSESVRWGLVLSIILPQFVLTSANSVLGTVQVCSHYFKNEAKKVTSKNLLLSIALGNLVTGVCGGLPFCHGAGGVTAHVKGGAKTSLSNSIMGITLIALAVFAFLGNAITPSMNPVLMGALLCSTGIFHMELARPLLKLKDGLIYVVLSASIVLFTKNLLLVLLAVVAYDVLASMVFKLRIKRDFLQ